MVLATTKTDTGNDDLEREINRLQTMINSPQMRELRVRMQNSGNPSIRPRNAATIILIDGDEQSFAKGDFKILMGQRNKALKFMPGALVFPGGAVDRADGSIEALDDFEPVTANRIHSNLQGRPSKRAARALALACARELAEETGLLLGNQTKSSPSHKDWHFYKNQNMAPAISSLRLLSRAVTPPGAPRRFDTWFFMAPASAIGYTPKGGFDPSGELENLHWLTPREAIKANTQEITRVMLVELMNRLQHDTALSPKWSAPHYYAVNHKFCRKVMD